MKILVVEDDPVSQKVIEKYLCAVGSCVVASNGMQALSHFKQAHSLGTPFNLICLDIMMPEMTGHQVLKAIRQFEQELGIDTAKGCKIIMTTGLNDAENVVGAFEQGCEAYVTKPIDKAQLLSELKKLGIYPAPN